MALPTASEIAEMSPMMVQYYQLKSQAHDAILFFRMGDFYEIFGDDALEVAPKLDLILTSREKGNQTRIPFCGVPHHSSRSYWLRLLSLGYKVAIAEQVQDPAEAKGLVKREIVRIYTPGVIDELEALDAQQPNYIMAVYENPDNCKVTIVVADISTGELRAGAVNSRRELLNLVQRFRPKEIVTRRFFKGNVESEIQEYLRSDSVVFGTLPEAVLRDQKEQAEILESVLAIRLPVATAKNRDALDECALLASFFMYLRSLQASTGLFVRVMPLVDPQTMYLSDVSRRDLELFETVRRRSSDGSLFKEINRCHTPMGARLLHASLRSPFLQLEPIAERQSSTKALMSQPTLMDQLKAELKGLPDIERLFGRVISGRCPPQELHRIRYGLQKVNRVALLLKELPESTNNQVSDHSILKSLGTELNATKELLDLVDAALADEPGSLGDQLNCIKPGFDAQFDDLRTDAVFGQNKILQYEAHLRDTTKIQSLKIKAHKSYGLQIEVTKSNLKKVPEGFIRRQTMVNNERFVTLDLQELDETLSQAREQALAKETALFQELLSRCIGYQNDVNKASNAIGKLDLVLSFAIKAVESGFCLPQISQDGSISLLSFRHPVVESIIGKHAFTPNNLTIDKNHKSVVITGPNMAGKSTVMRQVAILAILHQIGSHVPATQASLPIFDNIFTRIGASDDIAVGKSTFMVEMSEASEILRQSTTRSLVILDEVGRGTSTEDGMAIALAILEDLTKRVKCYCMFATHFHELIPLAKELGAIKFLQTEVKEGDQIKFTHRIVEGVASHSFGIEVARLAGIPDNVLKRAACNLIEKSDNQRPIESTHTMNPMTPPQKDNAATDRILSKLESINLNRITPIQALNHLETMQRMLDTTFKETPFNLLLE